MANVATKSTAFLAFNATFLIPVSPEIFEVIEETSTLKKVEDNGNLFLEYTYTAEADINKISLQVKKEYVGISNKAGMAAKHAVTLVENLMQLTDQIAIPVKITDAVYQMYKPQEIDPNVEIEQANLDAIASITGKTLAAPTNTPAKSRVNLRGIL